MENNINNKEDSNAQQSSSQQPSTASPLKFVPKNISAGKLTKLVPIVVVMLIIGAGVASGLVISSRVKSASTKTTQTSQEETVGEEVQKSFTQTFRDEAEGLIEKNDKLDKYAQGTHMLIRPGGESQTAYLTSSVLDLSEYEGKKVKVYGETFGSSQVGWLMDVGKVDVLE